MIIWRFITAAWLLTLAACGDPPRASFYNTDITGSQIGQTLAGLMDPSGKTREISDFKGKVLIVFFGYTSCPDICPTALSRFTRVVEQLGPLGERVQVLLITVDPEHDSAERLEAYVSGFHPSFIGLRGDMQTLAAAAREFKVFYALASAGGPGQHAGHHGGRMIDHTSGAYVYDPAGRIRLFVKDDASVESVVSDLHRLLKAG